jgi:hypothetical protein
LSKKFAIVRAEIASIADEVKFMLML